jgi:thiamine biosynthesis lipoprotein
VSRKSSLALVLLLARLAAARDWQRFEAAQPHMGTLFSITVYAPDRQATQAAFREAFARIEELDNELSDYKPESELMRVCRTAYRSPVAVSADLFTVLEKAQQLARDTGGAFDVTLGPVILLWRDARKTKTLPAPDALARAQRRTGYDNLILDPVRKTVALRLPDMQLDLGAIAKGYAADEALHVLRGRGMGSALVAASGDLAIGDAPPGKAGWRVAIDLPGAPAGQYSKILTLHNTAVSTSGDTEQYVEIAGVRYSHIIDPKTGKGLTERVGVTVIAPRGMDADSYATALSVLTAQHGVTFAMAWAEARAGISARILLETPNGWELTDSRPLY